MKKIKRHISRFVLLFSSLALLLVLAGSAFMLFRLDETTEGRIEADSQQPADDDEPGPAVESELARISLLDAANDNWSYSIADTDILAFDSIATIDVSPDLEEGEIAHEYRFKGLAAGETTVIFTCTNGENEGESMEYTIMVDSELNATLKDVD